mmetsp:Transcript_9413/g.38110  ORF Transcript_9413/g.38110 Transcript_9413/m.38110 type:complete len:282 (-) Transcript_9413:4080-4925(-)
MRRALDSVQNDRVHSSGGFCRVPEHHRESVPGPESGLEVEWRPNAGHFTVVHDRHAVREYVSLVHEVGGEQNRGAHSPPEATDDLPGVSPAPGVHAARWLIQDHHRRISHERHRHREFPALAPGEHAGLALGLALETNGGNLVIDLAGYLGLWHSSEPGKEFEVFPRGERRPEDIELGANAEVLSDRLHISLDAHAVDRGGASVLVDHAGEHGDGGGLAGAVVSEERGDLPTMSREVKAVDRPVRPEGLNQTFDSDHGHGVVFVEIHGLHAVGKARGVMRS